MFHKPLHGVHTKFQVCTVSLKKVMIILENVLQVAYATLKTDLHPPGKVFHDPDTFLLGEWWL